MSRDGIVSSQVKKLSKTRSALIKEQQEYMKYHEYMEQSNHTLLKSNKKLFESLKQRYEDFIALIKKHNDIDISLNNITITYKNREETNKMIDSLFNQKASKEKGKHSNSKNAHIQKEMLINTIKTTKNEVRELHSTLKLVEQQTKYEESFSEENKELKIRKNELEKKAQVTQKEILFLQNQFRDRYPYDTYPELAILFKKMNDTFDSSYSLRKNKLDLIRYNNQIQMNREYYEKKKKIKPEVVLTAFELELNSDTSAESISGVCASSEDLSIKPRRKISKKFKNDSNTDSTVTEVKSIYSAENQESYPKDKIKTNQSFALDKKRQKIIQQITMNQPISLQKKDNQQNNNTKPSNINNGILSESDDISETKSSQELSTTLSNKSSRTKGKSHAKDKSVSQHIVLNSPDMKNKHQNLKNNSILTNNELDSQNEKSQSIVRKNKSHHYSQNINPLADFISGKDSSSKNITRNQSFSNFHASDSHKGSFHLHNSIRFPRNTTTSDADQDSIIIGSTSRNGNITNLDYQQYDTYTQTEESLRSLRAAFLNEELQRFKAEDRLNESIHHTTMSIDEIEMDIIVLQRERDLRKKRLEARLKRFKLITSTTFDFDENALKHRVSTDIQTDSVPLISNLRDEIMNNTQINPKDLLIRQEENDLVALLSQRNLELEIIKMANVRKQLDLDSLLKRLKIVDPLLYSAETHEPAQIAVDPVLLEKRQSKQDKLDSLEAHIEEAFNEGELLSTQIADQQFLIDTLTRNLTNMAYEPRSDVSVLCRSLKKDRSVITENTRQLRFVNLEEESVDKTIYYYSEKLSKEHLLQMKQRVDSLYCYLNKLKARFNNQRALKEKRTLTLTSEDELNSIQRKINDVLSEIDVYRMRTNGIISKIEKQTRVILAKNIRYPEPISTFKRHEKSRSSTTKL